MGYNFARDVTEFGRNILWTIDLDLRELRLDCLDVWQVAVIIVQVGQHDPNHVI